MNELAAKFDRLFAGRQDVYGTVTGGCVREPLTIDLWEQHLFGEGSVGVYPVWGDVVHWGAVDIDEGFELAVLAENLCKVLDAFGIKAWQEKTKGKGWHVFIFTKEWVSAKAVRRCLLVACDVAGVPPKEVNPKQESTTLESPGNYLNIPYAKTWSDLGKRVVLQDATSWYEADRFVDLALESRNSTETIEKVAQLYKQPKKPTPSRSMNHSTVAKTTPLIRKIVAEGPLDGNDRSTTLAHLAHICRDAGLSAQEAFSVLKEGDSLWGKFNLRKDCDEQLWKLVDNAY